jgi:hypothetical protein
VNGCSSHAIFSELFVVPLNVSKFTTLLLDAIVIVPPYCGVPRLSHQCPVPVVVTEAVAVVDVVVVAVGFVVVVVVFTGLAVVVVVVTFGVVVDLLQDASINAAGIKKLNTSITILFFTLALLF